MFDISLCGGQCRSRTWLRQAFGSLYVCHLDYAGNQAIFQQTCPGVCYDDWVVGAPSNYDNAYFEVSYIRVYGDPGELTVLSSHGRRSAALPVVLTVFIGALTTLVLML